nr:unnamed protein product [Callosobruchus analis]
MSRFRKRLKQSKSGAGSVFSNYPEIFQGGDGYDSDMDKEYVPDSYESSDTESADGSTGGRNKIRMVMFVLIMKLNTLKELLAHHLNERE